MLIGDSVEELREVLQSQAMVEDAIEVDYKRERHIPVGEDTFFTIATLLAQNSFRRIMLSPCRGHRPIDSTSDWFT